MNTTDNPKENKNMRVIVLFLAIALTGAVLSSVPSVQNKVKSLFTKSNRVILAKVTSFYGTEQSKFLILKVKEPTGLEIEIYEMTEGGQQVFRQKFDLAQDTDAYITLDKNTTNLALSDVDKDGLLDILAPSVDRNGNLRFNTFRYNSELKMFEPFAESK